MKKPKKRKIAVLLIAVIAAFSVMSFSAAAAPFETPDVLNGTHAEEQILVENEKDSGLFFNAPIPTTTDDYFEYPAQPYPTETPDVSVQRQGVITGAVAAPIAAIIIASATGGVVVALHKRKGKKD